MIDMIRKDKITTMIQKAKQQADCIIFVAHWGTEDETAWKYNYALWMHFVNDFKNAGGRVAAGADSGFIYSVYGFGYIRELELLREAGFLPLEVLSAATLNGAELLGIADSTGSVEVGKKADLIIAYTNPLQNFKTLYGSGHYRLNMDTNTPEFATSLRYTLKDGIVFDAQQLLADVRDLVSGANGETLSTPQIK